MEYAYTIKNIRTGEIEMVHLDAYSPGHAECLGDGLFLHGNDADDYDFSTANVEET